MGGCTITSKPKINVFLNFFLHSAGPFGAASFEKFWKTLRQVLYPVKMRPKLWKSHIVYYLFSIIRLSSVWILDLPFWALRYIIALPSKWYIVVVYRAILLLLLLCLVPIIKKHWNSAGIGHFLIVSHPFDAITFFSSPMWNWIGMFMVLGVCNGPSHDLQPFWAHIQWWTSKIQQAFFSQIRFLDEWYTCQ